MQKSPRKSQDILEEKEWVVEACFTRIKTFYRAVVIKMLVMAQEYTNSLDRTGQTLQKQATWEALYIQQRWHCKIWENGWIFQ